MSLAKPQLRGLLASHVVSRFKIAGALGVVSAAIYASVFGYRRMQMAHEYFAKTDMNELFQIQSRNGCFRYKEFWDDDEE